MQGSILALLLFSIYVNDFNKSNSLFNIIFADNTSSLCKGKDLNEVHKFVTENLSNIFNWYCFNRLALNVKKTNVMVFSTNDEIVNDFPNLLINSTPVQKISMASDVKTVLMLGIYLDRNLNFKENSERLLSKISKSFFIKNRAKNILPSKTIKLLYFSLEHSHLNFASLFLNHKNSIVNKIEIMQKKIIRIIAGLGFREHVTQAFIEQKILPSSKLIKFNIMKSMWQYKVGKLPCNFDQEWTSNFSKSDRYNLRNLQEIYNPCTNLINIDKMTYFN